MSNYLYPIAIELDDLKFEKLDVEIGSAQFASVDFVMMNAGKLDQVEIHVDRDASGGFCTKSVDSVKLYDGTEAVDVSAHFNGDDATLGDIAPSLPRRNTFAATDFHADLKSGANAAQMLNGLVYAMMVKSIFGVTMSITNFSDVNEREDGDLFSNDPTGEERTVGGVEYTDLVDEVEGLTKLEFNKTLQSGKAEDLDEYNYWNARTLASVNGLIESEFVGLHEKDMYVMYSVKSIFKNALQDVPVDSLTAINSNDTTDASIGVVSTPIVLEEDEFLFVLGYNCVGKQTDTEIRDSL